MGERDHSAAVLAIAAGLAGGFLTYFLTGWTFSNYAWCVAGEEHCIRQWISALSGWVAASIAGVTVYVLWRQAESARNQAELAQTQLAHDRESHRQSVELQMLPIRHQLLKSIRLVYGPVRALTWLPLSIGEPNPRDPLWYAVQGWGAIRAGEKALRTESCSYLLSIDEGNFSQAIAILERELQWFQDLFLHIDQEPDFDARRAPDGTWLRSNEPQLYENRARGIAEAATYVQACMDQIYERHGIMNPARLVPTLTSDRLRFDDAARATDD